MFDNKETDWDEKFSRWSPDTRRKVLAQAASRIAAAETNPNEKKLAVCQLRAALAIDPNLVLNVLAAARGNDSGISESDLEKLKQEAAEAQANFNGLVNATKTLRASMTEIGAISKNDRLPETIQDWNFAIGNVVGREAQRLAVREARLEKQTEELEVRRKEILAEIEAAQNSYRIGIPSVDDKTSELVGRIGTEVAGLFQQEIAKIVASAAEDAKGLILKRFVSLTDQTEAKIAQAKGTIAGMAIGFGQAESYEIGQLVNGKGIYAGTWDPHDREGNALGKTYNVFAAPEDLTNSSGAKVLFTFKGAAQEVGQKKSWHNHKGLLVPDSVIDTGYEAYLYEALKKNDANGEWFIPPRDLLYGKNVDGNEVHLENNLYALKDTGAFTGTFTTASDSATAQWYWSSSEHRGHADYVWGVRVTDGNDVWNPKDNIRLSCRPVRVELAL